MAEQRDHLNQPILSVSRTDVTTLYEDLTVQQALDDIRLRGVGDKIVYFYVIDRDDRLAGVIPTRRLLTAPLEQRLSKVMVQRIITIPQSATVVEAC
ncbi:MAG: CBS domain-containing protein, partial [Chitinivibrionales bacterium]|nr:CBS domain-containing protein [Chitinivibrionales bacterium]